MPPMAEDRARKRVKAVVRLALVCVALCAAYVLGVVDVPEVEAAPVFRLRKLLADDGDLLAHKKERPGDDWVEHCKRTPCSNVTCDDLDSTFGPEDRSCAVVQMYCLPPVDQAGIFGQGFVNYVDFHYCVMHGSKFFSYLTMLFALLMLFILLGTTADDWFVPCLASISNALQLSPNVAGESSKE